MLKNYSCKLFSDFCADSIERTWTLSGSGTICGEVITAVKQIQSINLPICFDMSQNFPNPFNPTTVIKFQLPKASFVRIKIYDAIGREVGILFEEGLSEGYYTASFDGSNLSTGMYFYRIETRDVTGESGMFVKTLKMVLIK